MPCHFWAVMAQIFICTCMPSSVIASYSYNPVNAVLRVRFLSGLIYDYKKVPLELYQAMRTARSKGLFLNKHIKGNYEYKKVG